MVVILGKCCNLEVIIKFDCSVKILSNKVIFHIDLTKFKEKEGFGVLYLSEWKAGNVFAIKTLFHLDRT
jgi:hypothetical protein